MCNSVPNDSRSYGKQKSLVFVEEKLENCLGSILPRDLRIVLCLACVYRVMDARREFGERERSKRVARGSASSNSILSAL